MRDWSETCAFLIGNRGMVGASSSGPSRLNRWVTPVYPGATLLETEPSSLTCRKWLYTFQYNDVVLICFPLEAHGGESYQECVSFWNIFSCMSFSTSLNLPSPATKVEGREFGLIFLTTLPQILRSWNFFWATCWSQVLFGETVFLSHTLAICQIYAFVWMPCLEQSVHNDVLWSVFVLKLFKLIFG